MLPGSPTPVFWAKHLVVEPHGVDVFSGEALSYKVVVTTAWNNLIPVTDEDELRICG